MGCLGLEARTLRARRPALTSHGLFPLRTSWEREQHLGPARAVLAVGTGRAPVGSTCPHCRARATPAVGIFWKREFPRVPGGLLDNAHWRQGLGRATADGAGAPDPSVSDGQGLGATRVHCLDPSTINKVHRERRLKQPLAHGRRGEKPPS